MITNNLFWQFVCIFLLFLCVMWNRAAWGDPKWPLLGLGIVIVLWALLALCTLVSNLWGLYQLGHQGAFQVRPDGIAMFSLLLMMVPLVGVVLFVLKARQVPPIHDISTDTVNPPEFFLVKAARHPSHNSLVFTPKNAELQREAYPGVDTLFVSRKSSELIVMAEEAVDKMGWRIYGVDRDRGVIEAYAVTSLLGFVDDIIIRVEPTSGDESQLDIRSASRVGVSDLGANAVRIHLFFDALSRQLDFPVQQAK
jgi:hypothetical protein